MTELPEPQRYTGHLLRRAQQRHVAMWAAQVSPEVSSVQFAALTVLDRTPGASQSDLGAALDLDRSTVADLVSRLERRGMILRSPHPTDRRANSMRLTDFGRAELDRLRPAVVEVNARLVSRLTSDEQGVLRGLLRRIVDGTQS